MFLVSVKFVWLRPNKRANARDALPYVPATGALNALGSKMNGRPVTGSIVPARPPFGSLTTSGYCPVVAATLLAPDVTLATGCPDARSVMPAICHPPKRPRFHAFGSFLKNGNS